MPKKLKYLFASSLALAFGAAGLSFQVTHAKARLIHVEPSEYSDVYVYEQGGERCMTFKSIEDANLQTCISLKDRNKLSFEYVQMMASGLLVNPEPRSILVIGLGGASLSNALHQLAPEATIDSVELDPAVVRVASAFFDYKTGPQQRVFIEEGRTYVEKASAENKQYDVVMLDAFGEGYIPEHMLTLEFLNQVRSILAPGGIMVTNTFFSSPFYDRETATYLAAFEEFYNLRDNRNGNRVIVAYTGGFPGMMELELNAELLKDRLDTLGIDIDEALSRFVVLDDDFDPEDVLRDPQ